MIEPPIPADEQCRIAALVALEILDTPPEERFDRITRIAARLFGVPMALISLVDVERQWFKSRVGLDVCETSRRVSFCGHAILHDAPLVIPDATLDPRFADNPLVTEEPCIRFYAGQPLHAVDGSRLGTLCLADRRPREMSPEDLGSLRDLAILVERELGVAQLARAQEALRESKARYHLLGTALEAAANAIVITDRDGIIEWVNRAFSLLTGYERHEAVGQSPRILKSDRQPPEFYQAMWEEILAGRVWQGEVTNRRKDGALYVEEMAITPIKDAAGRVVNFVAVKQDITERKKIDRMKNEFISTVSHELRTPLTSIRGSLGLIQGGVAGEISGQARALVDIAANNSERLVRLINDILDIEKIESGRMEFRMQPVEASAFVRQSIQANEAYAAGFGVRFELRDESKGARVTGDSDRLNQVLTNLLSNAAKFSPRDATVAVSVTVTDGRVRIAVTDTGPGIPEAFHARIFQKFSQADSSNTRQKGGTGLGLSISKAIVEKHAGRIGFESTAGSGATFFFEIPLLRSEPEAVSAAERPRVLIVEDDANTARALTFALKYAGFDSVVASDADRARECLAQQSFAAITLDLSLPGQDGISFIRDLRGREGTRQIPVVVISGHAEENRESFSGNAMAIVDWLQKPIDRKRLTAALRDAVHHRDHDQPRILHVEDDPDIRGLVALILKGVAEITAVPTLAAAGRALSDEYFDLVILDLGLPDGSGLTLLPLLRRPGQAPVPVVVFSARELDAETAERMAAVLVKSRTSNDELVDTISSLVRSHAGAPRG